MARYLIGDLHGHFGSLTRLLKVIDFKEDRDELWFTGDLVNRGPSNVDVLRWMQQHDDNIVAVMGNHDAHLIACHRRISRARKTDTIQDVLAAKDRPKLVAWLARRPLLHTDGPDWLVHGGLLPDWSRKEARKLARKVSKVIRSTDAVQLLARRQPRPLPRQWRDAKTETDQLRLAFYAFINLRMVTRDGAISFSKSAPDAARRGEVPWFEGFKRGKKTLHFGHWAGLGLRFQAGIRAMDSGAAWGGQLTALRLNDQALFQVSTRSW